MKITYKVWMILVCCFMLQTKLYAGAPQPPQPPSENPHPPATEADKKRVNFGNLVIEKLLMPQTTEKAEPFAPGTRTETIKLDLDEACIMSPDCIKQKTEAHQYLVLFKTAQGPITKYVHTHVIPWSFKQFEDNKIQKTAKPMDPAYKAPNSEATDPASMVAMPTPHLEADEYMLHSYVTFKNGIWYHLDIIVTEDKDGNLKLRRLFLIPIPSNARLPDGVVC